MKKVYYTVYKFKELSKEAKQKAIDDYYEDSDYPFLYEELYSWLEELLEKNKITITGETKLYYSLSYSQGDGLCFIGNFKWRKYYVKITHSGHYYYSNSTTIDIENEEAEYASEKTIERFKKIYTKICDKLEKIGYEELEYRPTFKEFEDLCDSNKYTFLNDGTVDNE